MKKLITILLVFIAFTHVNAQAFFGGGYVNTHLSGSGLDVVSGFSFMVEKDIALSKSGRFKMHPNFNVSFLYSNIDRQFTPFYLNIISLSPKVSYEVISSKRIKIAPYGNPLVSYLLGLDAFNFLSSTDAQSIDEFRGGFELGLRTDIILGKTTVRIIPLAGQLANNYHRQYLISLLVSL